MNKGRMNGGIMKLDEDMASHGMTPNWTVYFTVKNLEESMAKVKKLGGQVHMHRDIDGMGRIAMIGDPAHAHFIIMQMSVVPEEWVE
jgi:predicted enzyme related to lactoylglutathione lyase